MNLSEFARGKVRTKFFFWSALKICFLLYFQLLGSPAYSNSGCQHLRSVSQDVLASALNGSSLSFQALLRQIRCLDGGELEDMYIGIGEALFANPKKLAPYVRASTNLTADDISSISSMLPARFADDPCAQVNELKRRVLIVRQNKLFEMSYQSVSIKSIEQAIAEVRSWCERTRNK
jgi:hypothetical protein